MGRVISIDKEVSFGKKEWDLLSFFLQNARTLCVRLAEGMGKKDGLQEYAKLLQSLWSSLDHAWAVAKSYADKGSADWEEARKLVVGIEHFVWVSGKVLSGVERSELVSEVAKLKEDLKDAEVEGAKLHQVVLGAEGQWKKVLDLVANNLGPYKMELGEHFKLLESMTSRFDRDFSVLLEEEKGLGDAAAQELHDFLSGVQDRLIELKQQGLAKELGLTA